MTKLSSLPLLILICLASCKKPDDPAPTLSESPAKQQGFYVVNEGNFQSANADVTFINPAKGSVSQDVYKTANNTSPGDVAQSLTFMGNRGYLVMNNSGKIIQLDTATFQNTGTITGFISPRYIAPLPNQKALVSDLYADALSLINMQTLVKEKSIPCKGWTEEMLTYQGLTYISNKESDYMYVYNPTTQRISDSIGVGYGSGSIQVDANGKLWVLCEGDQAKGKLAALTQVDPATQHVLQKLSFASGDSPMRLRISPDGKTLYYLNNHVYQLSISATQLPTQAFIAAQSRNFYGLDIHPQDGTLFVTNSKDYVQTGELLHVKPDGTLINTYPTGINPNSTVVK